MLKDFCTTTYSFTVVTTDTGGLTDEEAVVVQVTDVNEAPIIITGAIAENAPTDTAIYLTNAIDVDAGQTLTF